MCGFFVVDKCINRHRFGCFGRTSYDATPTEDVTVAITAEHPPPTPSSRPPTPQRFRRELAETTDSELMRLVSLGDREAFGAVYELHASSALAVALRITRSREAAEEVVQETFVGLWRGAGSYSAVRGSLRGFVLGIAHHRAIDALRRDALRAGRRTSDEGLEESHESPRRTDIEAAQREEAASVRAALEVLKPHQRRVIELAYFGGLSHSEVAARLQLPLGTVKSRIRVALAKLHGQLALTDMERAVFPRSIDCAGARGE
jgi:RNA polymerase sigma-70 factor (ECF subfamily)